MKEGREGRTVKEGERRWKGGEKEGRKMKEGRKEGREEKVNSPSRSVDWPEGRKKRKES